MAEAFYMVSLPDSAKTIKKNGKDKIIVSAESSAEALLIGKAALHLPSDAAWASATATALAHVTDLEGWRANVKVATSAGVTVADVTVTAASGDTFDEIGDDLVTALNATDDIAGAAYSTPNLTIAETTDSLGDHVVTVKFLPPITWSDPTIEFSSLFGTVTDEGVSGAALAVVLNDVVAPTKLYEVS